MKSQIKSKLLDFFIIFFGILSLLPFLAPIFLHLGLSMPAKLIYLIYSFFCHQFSSRSILIFDYQLAWCARDTAIWIGILLSTILVKYGFLPKIRWYHILPFVIPMALDGGLQTIFTILDITPSGELAGEVIYISSNLTRFMTGALFGIGVGWFLGWFLADETAQQNASTDQTKYQEKFKLSSSKRLNIILKTLLLLFFMFLFYTFLIFFWRITSPLNPPLDFLDSAVRTPSYGFFDRRGLGACPSKGTVEVFNPECFFQNP